VEPTAFEAQRPGDPHPVRVIVEDELERSRLTVFFRLILVIPHLIWLLLWSFFAVLISMIAWVTTLVAGHLPASLHDFFSSYVRYVTHVYAYLFLAANPYPGFVGSPGYPIDVEIDPPAPQRRWKTLLRIFLALPALFLAQALASAGPSGGGGTRTSNGETEFAGGGWFDSFPTGVFVVAGILGWFACMALGRMPHGFRDLQAYCLRYGAQTWGFLLFLTDRYPTSDPAFPAAEPPARHQPVRVVVTDDRRRSRFTVFFRFLLFLPHLVWYLLWTVAVFFAVIASWFAALATGRTPGALHRFVSAYVRYQVHVFAYLFIVANPFPGFTGTPGIYPVDIEIDGPERQSRWITLFRLFLALPAWAVVAALNGALFLVGIGGWFASLALGRMPEGLRNLGAFILRYTAQFDGYLYLLTDRYPYSGPWEWSPAPEPEPEVVPA
jgi:hypothetical protein